MTHELVALLREEERARRFAESAAEAHKAAFAVMSKAALAWELARARLDVAELEECGKADTEYAARKRAELADLEAKEAEREAA